MPLRRSVALVLPSILRDEPPSVKLLWLWLEPQGVVTHSQRAMAEALGLDIKVVGTALSRLRALGLVEDLERTARRRGRLRAVRHI
jgi:DNA-binding MarR family transcriptional regulator